MFGKDKNKGLQALLAPEPKSETQKMMDMGNDWEASRIEAIESPNAVHGRLQVHSVRGLSSRL